MSHQTTAWDDEIERRIRIYDALEASGEAQGRLGAVDYLALAGLVVLLSAGFWSWGGA